MMEKKGKIGINYKLWESKDYKIYKKLLSKLANLNIMFHGLSCIYFFFNGYIILGIIFLFPIILNAGLIIGKMKADKKKRLDDEE